MNKNISRIALAAAAAMFCVSCQEYLTTPPEGSLSQEGYYVTEAHVEQGVLGAYSSLRNIEANQYIIASEDRSDNVWVEPAPNGIRTFSEVAYLRCGTTIDVSSSLWSTWYSLIHNANTVLENLDKAEYSSESVKNQFKGELLFLRGYAHFELARTFGNVPIVDHVLSAVDAKTIKQSPAADVINNRVIPDLKEAESLLPYEEGIVSPTKAIAGGEGRADKVVAQAMLARVYMTLKGYPYNDASAKAGASEYLKKVLDYSASNGNKYWAPNIDEWSKQWLTEPAISNKYQIFSIQHRNDSGCGVTGYTTDSGLNGAPDLLPYGGGGSLMLGSIYPEATLWYEYTRNSDKRGLGNYFLDGFDAFGAGTAYSNKPLKVNIDGTDVDCNELSINTKFIPFVGKRERYGISYNDQASTAWPLNFPILRLEDMMLLYAEILVEDNNVAQAMGYVNKIRERAGVPAVSTSLSSADAMKAVKRERQLELYLEGTRWFDLVRYNEWITATTDKYDRYKIDGKDRVGVARENVYGQRFYLPIPDSEIKAVPGLYVQNPDW